MSAGSSAGDWSPPPPTPTATPRTRPGPSGRLSGPSAPRAESGFCVALSYGRAERLTDKNRASWPGGAVDRRALLLPRWDFDCLGLGRAEMVCRDPFLPIFYGNPYRACWILAGARVHIETLGKCYLMWFLRRDGVQISTTVLIIY